MKGTASDAAAVATGANGPSPDAQPNRSAAYGGVEGLFRPASVAVIGASPNPAKVSYKVAENIIEGGFKGTLHLVNPKGGEMLGRRILKSLDEAQGPIDLACVVVPAAVAVEAVEECGRRGVRFVMVITSGFSEIGKVEEERRLVAAARRHGMRLLGPNIFGVYSAASDLCANFGFKGILKGNVAIVTQSGALGIAMMGKTASEGIGLSAMVSIGNKADLQEADLLGYLVDDPLTKVILLYIEGVQDGERLVGALKAATRRKPVVVIKSGRSKRGAMAAASHTGSLAGQDEVFDDVMRQCGVMRAESIDEAFAWCKFLAKSPTPPGENCVIVTNGGGVGVMATDACEKHGVALFDDTQALRDAFKGATPEFGSTKNPVDITGQATEREYKVALDAALKHPSMHSVIALYCETALFDASCFAATLREVNETYLKAGKPIVFSLIGGEKVEAATRELRKSGVPVFEDVYEAVSCMGALYHSFRHSRSHADEPEPVQVDVASANAIIAKARADGRHFLLAHESQMLGAAIGIPTPRSRVARNIDDAVKAAREIGFPVVMKVVSKDIIHKSDAGGIALDLQDDAEVVDAYQAIMHSCRAAVPNALIEGVEVAEMVRRGTETIVGARRDRSFGPTVMFGLGGIYVEVMKDVAFRAHPLSRREAASMVQEIRSYALLLGVRGEKRRDIDRIVDAILRAGALLSACPDISDIEINPLVAYEQGEGVKAVDIRVLLTAVKGGAHG